MNPIRYSTSPAPWVPGALLYRDDCLKVLRSLPADSVSTIITDPPYGLSDVSSADTVQAITAWASGDRERVPDGRGFMGHEWDRFVPPPAVWDECLRVLKPGGYMAVFAGSRTADLMGLSIRLAGFEMRDTITWMYSSGFPKSLDVGKAIDKAAGVERKILGIAVYGDGHVQHSTESIGYHGSNPASDNRKITAPATKEARQWDGWGTALKPAGEPIIVARKPFVGTVAANVLKHGTGGMNIDGCRVLAQEGDVFGGGAKATSMFMTKDSGYRSGDGFVQSSQGRWPANVVLSHGEDCELENCVEGCPVAELNAQAPLVGSNSVGTNPSKYVRYNVVHGKELTAKSPFDYNDGKSTASRFYPTFRYQAKAPKSERPVVDGEAHPTVKPLALCEWLVKLFTPPYGAVLDPFTGSGTFGQAAMRQGFNSIIIENNSKYWPLIDKRFGDDNCALYPIAG